MVGETVGSYRIERELGSGGMGAVYLARHALLDKLAAVKMLRPQFSMEKEAIDRFFTEAKATTAVRHPGIVDVYDFGFHESGSAFLVMELLEGESLGDTIREGGPIASGLAAAVGWQVAGALAAAHERDIIHRDLKPDNIFLIEDDTAAFGVRAKVLDFGIAKLTKPGSVEHTSPGEIIGTPLYMSPEQCRGQSLTGQSDVYSLGCLLFHAVGGEPPYASDDAVELLKCHALAPIPRLSRVAPAVWPALDEVIYRCMSKEAAARPDCAELAETLREIAEGGDRVGVGQLATVAPTVPETDGDDPDRTRPAWMVWALGAAVVGVVAIAIAMLGGGDESGGDVAGDVATPAETPTDTPADTPAETPASSVDAGSARPVIAETTPDAAPPVDAAGSPTTASRGTAKKKKPKKKRKKKWGELLPR